MDNAPAGQVHATVIKPEFAASSEEASATSLQGCSKRIKIIAWSPGLLSQVVSQGSDNAEDQELFPHKIRTVYIDSGQTSQMGIGKGKSRSASVGCEDEGGGRVNRQPHVFNPETDSYFSSLASAVCSSSSGRITTTDLRKGPSTSHTISTIITKNEHCGPHRATFTSHTISIIVRENHHDGPNGPSVKYH